MKIDGGKSVFFESGVIMTCSSENALRRHIRKELSCNGPMKYWFRPTEEWRKAMKRYGLKY